MADEVLLTLVRICVECGHRFEMSADEQQRMQERFAARGDIWYPPRRCADCRSARRHELGAVVDDGTRETLECTDCGEPFFFGDRDRAFYASRGWARPRRCKPCRERRREG